MSGSSGINNKTTQPLGKCVINEYGGYFGITLN